MGERAGASPADTRRVTRAAYSLLFVFGLSVGLPGPAAPSLQHEYGLTYAGTALHLTLFSLGSALGSALDGRLGQQFARAVLLRAALVGVGVGAVMTALAPTAVVSLGGTTIMGAGGTIAVNIAHGVLGSTQKAGRSTALVNAHLFAAVGLATAAVMVAGARAAGQWRLAFVAPLAVVAVILCTRQAAGLPTRLAEPVRAQRPRPPPTAVRIGGVVLALSVTIEWAVTFWAATFLRHPIGLAPASADAITVVVLAAFVVGRWVLGRLTTRRAPLWLLRAVLVVTITMSVPYLAGSRLPDQYGVVVPVGALICLCLLVTMLFPLALAATLSTAGGTAAEQQRASAIAMGTGAVGAVLTPYLLGAAADATTLTLALTALPAAAFLALAGIALMRRSALSPQ